MNPELRGVTTQQIVAALESDGFRWTSSNGSHRIYRSSGGRRVVVSFHRPGATFPPKTLTSMIAGARWTNDDFRRLKLIT